MHEFASRLVGLYFCDAIPQAISIGFTKIVGPLAGFGIVDAAGDHTEVSRQSSSRKLQNLIKTADLVDKPV
jgi:hypothetical protein